MATTQRAERRPAPQHNGTWLLLGVAITLIVLAGIILLTRSSGSEQTSGVNTAANTTAQVPSQAQLAGATTQNYKFGEYSRPSTTPLPQIKDPAEMVASFFWLNTSRRFQHKYSWDYREYDRDRSLSKEFVAVAGNTSGSEEVARGVYRTQLQEEEILGVTVEPANGMRITNEMVPLVVALRSRDNVYGTERTVRYLVVLNVAERGVWEIVSLDLWKAN